MLLLRCGGWILVCGLYLLCTVVAHVMSCLILSLVSPLLVSRLQLLLRLFVVTAQLCLAEALLEGIGRLAVLLLSRRLDRRNALLLFFSVEILG